MNVHLETDMIKNSEHVAIAHTGDYQVLTGTGIYLVYLHLLKVILYSVFTEMSTL